MFSLVGNPKRVALAKLIFEGHQEFDTEEVREMEASFADTGGEPLQVPLVEKETFKVITGRTRLKALKRAGRKDVLVQFATGSRADLARASIIENLRRRHDSKAKLLELLETTRAAQSDAEYKATVATNCAGGHRENKGETKKHRGRPSEGKGEARKTVAAATGQTAEAIRKQESRARAEEKKAAEPQPEIKVPPLPPIKTLGLDVPADVFAAAEKEQELVDKMDRLLTELNRTYTAYQDARGERVGLKTGQRHQTALKSAFDAFSTIRGQRPEIVCPHCKLWPEIRKTCACCRSTGFIGKADLDRVEKCLLAEGDGAGVWLNGKWRTMISLRGDDF